jgi:hypothetical protein
MKWSSRLELSRRRFLELGSATALATGIGCNSQPEPSKTRPAESTAPAPPAAPSKQLAGTAPNTILSKEYVETIARFAYYWAWPMVNSINRRTALTSVPEPGLRGGVLPNAPNGQICMLTDYISWKERFVACPNQDVTYGFGFGSLDQSPIVYQVPDFGDRYYIYAAWDARTDSFAQIGTLYGTKPGFYMLVGPDWNDKTPSGITKVFRSRTNLVALCPRVFLDDTPEDRKAILPVLSQVMSYHLNEYDGKMKTKDWTKVPSFPVPSDQGSEEVQWVPPEHFFDQLPQVINEMPPLPGEEGIYSMLRSLLDTAQKDPQLKESLKQIAIACNKEMIPPLKIWKNNGPSAGNGWYSPVNNGDWGLDYAVRTAVSKSNMYENRFNESKYIFTDTDSDGKPLTGSGSYSVTFPAGQLPPVDGFWSLTLYNDAHLFSPNPLNRFSLGTKNKNLQKNPDGSLTIYASAKSPGKDKETNWIPAPNTPFSLYIRCYSPKQEVINASWAPPKVERHG